MAEYLKDIEREFDRWAEEGAGSRMEGGHFPSAKVAIDCLEIDDKSSILDLSCGSGWALRHFLKKGFKKAAGSDVSFKMLKEAKDETENCFNEKNFIFVKNRAEQLPFKSNTFDIVFNMEAFYYYEHPERAAFEINRVLKKGGIFMLLTDYYKENEVSSKWRGRLKISMHLYSIDEYIKILKSVGFKIKKILRIVVPEIKSKYEFKSSESIKTYDEYRVFKRAGTLYIESEKD